MKRTANAHWTGTIKQGKGELTTASGVLLHTNYSFKTRFTGEEKGTNPEELLAAAHAGCFTMAVSYALTEIGKEPISLRTEAILTMEGNEIKVMELFISGQVPDISTQDFDEITESAKENCLISKALKIPITAHAILLNNI